jgi:hypothetical protein
MNGRVMLGARLDLVEAWFAEPTNRGLRRSAHRLDRCPGRAHRSGF